MNRITTRLAVIIASAPHRAASTISRRPRCSGLKDDLGRAIFFPGRDSNPLATARRAASRASTGMATRGRPCRTQLGRLRHADQLLRTGRTAIEVPLDHRPLIAIELLREAHRPQSETSVFLEQRQPGRVVFGG